VARGRAALDRACVHGAATRGFWHRVQCALQSRACYQGQDVRQLGNTRASPCRGLQFVPGAVRPFAEWRARRLRYRSLARQRGNLRALLFRFRHRHLPRRPFRRQCPRTGTPSPRRTRLLRQDERQSRVSDPCVQCAASLHRLFSSVPRWGRASQCFVRQNDRRPRGPPCRSCEPRAA
jgi:hypothetical protein